MQLTKPSIFIRTSLAHHKYITLDFKCNHIFFAFHIFVMENEKFHIYLRWINFETNLLNFHQKLLKIRDILIYASFWSKSFNLCKCCGVDINLTKTHSKFMCSRIFYSMHLIDANLWYLLFSADYNVKILNCFRLKISHFQLLQLLIISLSLSKT